MRILLVDDEKNIRELMGKFLSLENIDSDGADNAYCAQRLLRETAYDACMVDLKMPGMDGLELIKWIRAEGFRMPVKWPVPTERFQMRFRLLRKGLRIT